jgi:hypothetical protein
MIKAMKRKVMIFMSKQMMACDEASFLVSYKEDNRLGIKKWWQLKMHMISCRLCRKYAKQIEQLHVVVNSYREVSDHSPCVHHLPKEAGLKMQQVLNSELNAK